MLKFSLMQKSQNSSARIGHLITKHGIINTPVFMPVGTRGSIKGLTSDMILNTKAQIILANTYHLMLRPGMEILQKNGGLHKFMNFNKPILTDSGGFQVMSLKSLRKINKEGVTFRSHIDGAKIILTPENVTKAQYIIGSDISMIFDECTPYPATYEVAKKSMELSLEWAERSKKAFIDRDGYGQFGIVQGSIYEDLRKTSAKELIDMNFDGYAIGGLAVGEGQELMFKTLDSTASLLPNDKPRYLMGVGKPSDIIGAVARGIDMFDCVIPTRSGRNGQIFTQNGILNIRNQKFNIDNNKIDENCVCYTCKNYTRSYIHYLDKVGEMLASTLMTIHNISFYQNLMEEIKNNISHGNLTDLFLKYKSFEQLKTKVK